MEAATENLQDEVGLFNHCQNLLSEIFSSLLFSVTGEPQYSSPIPPGEHSARWWRPSQRGEHGGGRRERLWQRLGPQQPGLHLGQVFIPVKNCLNLRTCCQEGEGQTVGQLDSPP